MNRIKKKKTKKTAFKNNKGKKFGFFYICIHSRLVYYRGMSRDENNNYLPQCILYYRFFKKKKVIIIIIVRVSCFFFSITNRLGL